MHKVTHYVGVRAIHEYQLKDISAVVVHDPTFNMGDCKQFVRDSGRPGLSYSFYLACNGNVYYFNPENSKWEDIDLKTNQLQGVLEHTKEIAVVASLKGETISV